jgi:hypothetical protein
VDKVSLPPSRAPQSHQLSTPKRERAVGSAYRYYAGFSKAFVSDIIDQYVREGARVLDPWNGSGTTTGACAERGIECVGMDINPGTIAIAWSQLASSNLITRLCNALAVKGDDELLGHAGEGTPEDLASVYFSGRSSRAIRSLRGELMRVSLDIAKAEGSNNDYMALSGAAFALLAQVISSSLRPLRGTNPSWFAKPKDWRQRVDVSPTEIRSALDSSLQRMARAANYGNASRAPNFRWPELLIEDSRRELAHLGKFDVVITSPPYCTRIDYAVATVPELIALGNFNQSDFEDLRSHMMGSLVTEKNYTSELREANSTVGTVLRAIHGHHTKAASKYYSRYFSKYFDDLLLSLDRITATVERGQLIFVLQNSYFKDIEIDLSRVVGEYLLTKGFRSVRREDYRSRSPIAETNPKSRHYRSSNVCAETVLVFSNF